MKRRFSHMLVATLLASGVGASPAAAQVMPDVMGTEDSARQMLSEAKQYVRDNGIDALIENIANEEAKFGGSKHHIAVEQVRDGRIYVQRHNKYQTLDDTDFTEQQDMNGKYFMQSFRENAQNGGGTTKLALQVPETGNVKTSWCINEWAPGHKNDYFITVCY